MTTDERIHFWFVGPRGFRVVMTKSGRPPTDPDDGVPAVGRLRKRFLKARAEWGVDARTTNFPRDSYELPYPLEGRYYYSFNSREELFEENRSVFNERARRQEQRQEQRQENWERRGPRLDVTMNFEKYVSLYRSHQEAYFHAVDATVACVGMGDAEGANLFATFCKEILERKSKGEIPWNEDRERLWRVEKRLSGERTRKVARAYGVLEEPSSSESEPAPPRSSSPESPA